MGNDDSRDANYHRAYPGDYSRRFFDKIGNDTEGVTRLMLGPRDQIWPWQIAYLKLHHGIEIVCDLGTFYKCTTNSYQKQPIQPKIVGMRRPDAW